MIMRQVLHIRCKNNKKTQEVQLEVHFLTFIKKLIFKCLMDQ